jgi:pimeloyl-ACP methyl ester carboxylesterase
MAADAEVHPIRQGSVEANGIRFGFLEAGSGPLVLLLHGFPDDAWTWSHQLPALAASGYRAVAPFMRGYPPTGPAPDGAYDVVSLGGDVAALIQELDGGPAYVVGHDWGAVATYGAIATKPEVIKRAAVIAVGHPSTFPAVLALPAHAHRAFHVWYFQLEGIADVVRGTELAIIDYLWQLWSRPGHEDEEHVERVKRETLVPDGALEAALSYYPALSRLRFEPEIVAQVTQPVSVPMLAIFGSDDAGAALSEGEEANFTGPYRREIVDGAGHFVQRERPETTTELLLEWFGTGEREPAAVGGSSPVERVREGSV